MNDDRAAARPSGIAAMRLTHGRAVALMVLVTLMWGTAGVITRHLEAARSFEVTFWRSAFNVVALTIALRWLQGPGMIRRLTGQGWALWVSGLCWAVMYTNFMVAITLTTVATVLVTMSIAPLLTALFARAFLAHRSPLRPTGRCCSICTRATRAIRRCASPTCCPRSGSGRCCRWRRRCRSRGR